MKTFEICRKEVIPVLSGFLNRKMAGDEIRRIANGETDGDLLDEFKPGASQYELAYRYLRLAARYVVRNYKLETFK